MKPVKVLSLFDGMACGLIAMQGVGLPVSRYVAFEFDKDSANAKKGRPYGFAALTASHNFPMIEQRGNVFDGDYTEFEGFDFLIGGSPCTYWSIAQKNNRETVASGEGWKLFCEYVRALNEAKPMYFIYENNKSMSKAIRESISNAFGFEPICINSALVSAQNRQRLYWVGKRNADGTYSKIDIEQPEDRGILLRDVLDDSCLVEREKAHCLKYQAGNARDYFKKHHTNVKFEPVCPIDSGKARTLLAAYSKTEYKNWYDRVYSEKQYKQQYDYIAEPVRVGSMPRPNGELSDSQGFRIYSTDGKSVSLKGRSGGAGGKTGLYAIPIEFDGDVPVKAVSAADGKVYRVYKVENGLITIKGKQYPIKLADGYYIIRKLTVTECKRLQTVPEWYEFPVADTNAYKMLGNGWTVDVISHLLKGCLNE